MLKIFPNFFNKITPKNCQGSLKYCPQFKMKEDVFELSAKTLSRIEKRTIKIYNAHIDKMELSSFKIDLSKPGVFVQKTSSFRGLPDSKIEYNPNQNAFISVREIDKKTNKIKKVPLEVNIAKSNPDNETMVYHIFKKDLSEEIGYVVFKEHTKKHPCYSIYYQDILKDYPDFGITGDRLLVHYVRNLDDKKYSGVALLADKLAVNHCIKNNIKPNIISYAAENSHIAHYKRGKRFLPLDFQPAIEFYQKNYNETDVNKIVKSLIEKSKSGEKIDISSFGEVPMFLPQNLISKFTEEIMQTPILI